MPTVVTVSSTTDRLNLLWQSCLVMALADATRPFSPKESEEIAEVRQDALNFFLEAENLEDLETICDFAEIDPDFFRTKALQILKSGVTIGPKEQIWAVLEKKYEPN